MSQLAPAETPDPRLRHLKRKSRRRLPRADAMTVDGGFDSRVNLRRRDTDCRQRLKTTKAGTPKQQCHVKTTPGPMSQLAPAETPDPRLPHLNVARKGGAETAARKMQH